MGVRFEFGPAIVDVDVDAFYVIPEAVDCGEDCVFLRALEVDFSEMIAGREVPAEGDELEEEQDGVGREL